MSADNYYLIRRLPNGKFVPVMGFASVDETPKVRMMDDYHFDSLEDAIEWASEQYSEYGVSVHPECWEKSNG